MNPRNTQKEIFSLYLTVILMPSCCTDERLSFFTFASVAENNRKPSYKNV
jgi:hypothetical protein